MSVSIYQTPTGTWYCQYRVPGQKSPVKEYFGQGEKGRKDALVRDREIKLMRARGQTVQAPSRVYLDKLAQLYMDDARARGTSDRWREEFAMRLNKDILPYLSSKPIEQIEYADILAMVSAWGKSVPTANRYLGYLRAVFRFGMDQEIISRNPMAKWRKSKEARKKHVLLTVEDLMRLISVANPHVSWALEVAWMTGARPGPTELFKIRYEDHDPRGLTLHIRGTKTAKADRLVTITQNESLRLLEMEPTSKSGYIIEYEGRPVKQMYKGLKTAAKRAGLTYDVDWYDVRHLYASDQLRNGADLAAVSALLGHADITTTQRRYYHLLAGEKVRATACRSSVTQPRKPAKVVKIR